MTLHIFAFAKCLAKVSHSPAKFFAGKKATQEVHILRSNEAIKIVFFPKWHFKMHFEVDQACFDCDISDG
jgi:hypothetical protein